MSFVDLPITFSPLKIADDAVAYLRANVPGWKPAEGHLEVWLVEALARLTKEAGVIASQMPSSAFREFGAQLLDLNRRTGTEATMKTTWTFRDTTGWVVPAGTLVGYRQAATTVWPFQVQEDFTCRAGTNQVTGIQVRAIKPGTAMNGIPTGTRVECINSYAYVNRVEVSEESGGGTDPETDQEYQDRLHEEMLLLSPRPILPRDFAILAARVPGVQRALPLNLYNPDDQTWNNERYLTLALVDEVGGACTPTVKDACQTYMDGLREVNFIVRTIDPTYTDINVDFEIKLYDGLDPHIVVESVRGTVRDWLDPATYAGGNEHPPKWRTGYETVRYLQVANLIGQCDGVEYLKWMLLNGARDDIPLAGVAPLPRPGIIIGTDGAAYGMLAVANVLLLTPTVLTPSSPLVPPATSGMALGTGSTLSVTGSFTPGVIGVNFGWWGVADDEDDVADGSFAANLSSGRVPMAGVWCDGYRDQLDLGPIDPDDGVYGAWTDRLDLSIGGIWKTRGYTWAAAASGAYDDRWTTMFTKIGTLWGSRDKSKLYLRFGNEMNAVSSSNWSVYSSEVTDYIAAYRRIVGLQRSILPGAKVVWCPFESTSTGIDVRTAYPGSSYVDVIGVDTVNSSPHVTDPDEWADAINAVDGYGAPVGLEKWRLWAASQGKPLALPEWSNPAYDDGGEAPRYIQSMHDWLVTHAGSGSGNLLYANYYNQHSLYRLYPWTSQPITWHRYREVF